MPNLADNFAPTPRVTWQRGHAKRCNGLDAATTARPQKGSRDETGRR